MWTVTNVSKEPAASIFRVGDTSILKMEKVGSSENIGTCTPTTKLHRATFQKSLKCVRIWIQWIYECCSVH